MEFDRISCKNLKKEKSYLSNFFFLSCTVFPKKRKEQKNEAPKDGAAST